MIRSKGMPTWKLVFDSYIDTREETSVDVISQRIC